MVTVFNPQALGDPGPTAATGIIGAGLSSATGLIANRKNNQIELLKQLLGTGGTILGNELERRSEAEQGRTGLKVLQQMGQLPPELQGIDLDKANIDPTTVKSGSDEAPSKKVFRRSDIIKLMQTDPDKYDMMQPEIMQAYREGRVKVFQ